MPSPDIRADCRALCALGGLDGDEAQHPAAIAALLGRLSAAGQGHFSEEPLSIIAAWDADDEALRALAVSRGLAPPRLPGAAERLPFEGEQWRARVPEEELICEPDVAPDAIPLEAGASQPAIVDPRRAFPEEYALLASWVQAQAVPAFARPASDSPPRRAASPSRPGDEAGDDAGDEAGDALPATEGGVLDAPAAPRHEDDYGSVGAAALEAAASIPIEEGYWQVLAGPGEKLGRPAQMEVLREAMRSGRVPQSALVFRERDGLWLPLRGAWGRRGHGSALL